MGILEKKAASPKRNRFPELSSVFRKRPIKLASPEEEEVVCHVGLEDWQEVERERVILKLAEKEEEEIEGRMAPVVLEEGREDEGGQKREEEATAEKGQRLEDLKWLVHWPLPGDEVGQRLLMIWPAAGGEISEAELGKQLGVREQTAREYVKSYRESGSSLAVIDGWYFNGGQQVTYRLEEHKGEVVQECVLRLLKDKPFNGRQLKQGLGEVLGDRTLDRYLDKSGFRQAEKDGLRERIGEYIA